MSRRMLDPLREFDWDRFRADTRAYMGRQQMTGRALSDAIGMSAGTIHGWLSGARRSVSGDAMASIAWAADLDLNDYITEPQADLDGAMT